MTIDTYMQYLGIAFGTIFVFFTIVAVIFLSFTCFVVIRDLYSSLQDRQPDILIFPMQLKRKDEEIKKLKEEIHETKQCAGKAFHNILFSGQKHDDELITKIALEGLNKMRQ